MDEAKIVTAAVALVELWEQIRKSPRVPWSDYWTQSIEEADKALREAVRGPDPTEREPLPYAQDLTALLKK